MLDGAVAFKKNLDAYGKSHSWVDRTKYGLMKLVEGAGYGVAAGTLAGAAYSGGWVGLLTAGGSMAVTGEAFAAAVENGGEKLVNYVISQADTKEQAYDYADAVVSGLETFVTGVAAFGTFKAVKGGRLSTKVGSMRSNLKIRAEEIFSKAKANPTFEAEISQGMAESLNKGFYHPRLVEAMLKGRYGEGAVTSTTMTDIGGKNVGLSVIGHAKTGIPFTEKGAPIFDSVAVCDLRLPREVASVDNIKLHFKTATTKLNQLIEGGVIPRSHFSPEALLKIQKGETHIPGFIWHHHEDFSRMQLVPEWYHVKTGHDGGMKFWPFTSPGDSK
jgi:hypothetical protein